MLVQTWALILAAYRELNAKKLFWITMGINLLVVLLYAALGINDEGVTLLHWQFSDEFFNAENVPPDLFYRLQFVSWGIPFWLSWIATILALVSTAGIVPDLVKGGVIETMLSKPISRTRLFLTRYSTGLIFVLLQVGVFSVGCFLVMGIRGGAWEPRLFLAIPIVLVFFSYLYAICALFGMLTRSTITSLLLTILIWFMLFLTNAADGLIIQQREGVAVQVERLEEQEANRAQVLTMTEQNLENTEPDSPMHGQMVRNVKNRRLGLEDTRERLEARRASLEMWNKWTTAVGYARTVLPKTSETIGLLERYLMSREELGRLMADRTGIEINEEDDIPAMADPEAIRRAELAMRDRSVAWIVGTSLLFEVFILGIATLLFMRRDF